MPPERRLRDGWFAKLRPRSKRTKGTVLILPIERTEEPNATVLRGQRFTGPIR